MHASSVITFPPFCDSCTYDYVEVRDGLGDTMTSAPLLGKFCGGEHPDTIKSSANSLVIKMRSDHGVTGTGFKINYKIGIFANSSSFFWSLNISVTFVDKDRPIQSTIVLYVVHVSTSLRVMYSTSPSVVCSSATCGGTYSGSEGVLQTPNFPALYANDLSCDWFIRAPTGHYLTFTFPVFSTEGNSDCLQGDYVQIRDYNETGESFRGFLVIFISHEGLSISL